VPHEQGEDAFIACTNCDYAANVEAAEFVREGEKPHSLDPLQKIATPNCTTIASVAAFTGVPASQTIKAVFYWWTRWGQTDIDGRLVFVLLRGDLDVSEVKLINTLGGGELRAATDEEIVAKGAVAGYASAVGLKVASGLDGPGIYIIADPSIEMGGNFVAGANEPGYHFIGTNYPRDFAISEMIDIAQADSGHCCPVCGDRLKSQRAIEAGHCFKLGTRYSEAVDATYLDDNGRPQPIFMGSYGIGLDRLMAIIVELHHDKDGIICPAGIAPYQVHLMHIGKGEEVTETAAALYQELTQAGYEVLYDDRELSAGVKFKDADLFGIPWRVTVGSRGLTQGTVEVKQRDAVERQLVSLAELQDFLSLKE